MAALIAVMAGLLAVPAAASAAPAGPGHNGPTRALEAAFKIAQYERAGDAAGCYPTAEEMAALIGERTTLAAGVAASLKAVKKPGVVYVVRRTTRCANMTMALIAKGKLWVLDSTQGKVEIQGQKSSVVPGSAGPLRSLSLTSKSFNLSTAEDPERLMVLCPKGRYPLGGGMSATPSPSGDGEGVYPHSYERLGAQKGWHVNPVLIDPSPAATTPRRVTLQVMCGLGLVPVSAPHKTVFLKSGQTKTATATCPKGQVLVSGGFQRTNFVRFGGDYVTESRAVGARSWRVSGRAFGEFGGELSAIAYCDRSRTPLLTQVSASSPVAFGGFARATTPACPKGQKLTLGGFSANGSTNALFADGSINANNTWSASAFGFFGPAPRLTSYGYCLEV